MHILGFTSFIARGGFLSATVFALAACSGSERTSDSRPAAGLTSSLEVRVADIEWVLSRYQTGSGDVVAVGEEADDSSYTIELSYDARVPGRSSRTAAGMIACNSYVGDYTLEDNVLTLFGVGIDDAFCGPSDNSDTANFFRKLLFEPGSSLMLSVDEEGLTMQSGNNEHLMFVQMP